ncbi:MAG: anaerobic glycerol-3-phosphate dehydrogenase subunit A [Deltaproteobacteria bacterium]|uniref:Glycerol-3-phosphate dehydrogenase n=1 Tax=Candidatus Zymogenus saltonus TaxID=2844893 RepID=A0A9D8KAI0_9DELT|nr:anaerobic glycerol-3-phosphate dehydrogenase subunit A [Candidatus Zymogenus saltonus]
MDFHTEVVVIGGGVTGTGIARDLTLRGIETILVEKGDLAAGATGRCHGLLHSGGRYAVKDPESARECVEENRILKKIASRNIEDTGGFFVRLPQDDRRYVDKFVTACDEVGIETEFMSLSAARKIEPNLTGNAREIIRVPDAAVDPFGLTIDNAADSEANGGRVMIHTEAVGIVVERSRVRTVLVRDKNTSETHRIRAKFVVNATGGWAGNVAALSGVHVPLSLFKGSLLIFNRRINNTIINRLRPPGDGDIIVPNEPTSIIGTTSIEVGDPEEFTVTREEVEMMLAEAALMLPPSVDARVIRAYAGIRPLLGSKGGAGGNEGGRDISRSFSVINHGVIDDVRGLVSVVGGKLTTYRLMAEKVVDLIAKELGVHIPCSTAERPILGSESGEFYKLGNRFDKIEILSRKKPEGIEEIICECELVTKKEILKVIEETGTTDLNDIQHRTRVGMGSCQGGFCTYRLLGILHELGMVSDYRANDILIRFLEERWRGIRPILRGDQLVEEQLMEGIYLGLFALDKVGKADGDDNAKVDKKDKKG